MPAPPSDQSGPALDESTETYCYRHTDRPTRLRCSRCDRPICGECSTPATVGQHCPECLAEARRTAPRVRSAMTATAPAVVALVVINVVVYLIQRAAGIRFTLSWALAPQAVADGEWWRLVTATFLHSPAFIFHILFNMLVLWIYGPNVEQAFGTARFVMMYLVAGFVASATSYAFSACDILGVGASGAIFGVVGILLVFLYNRRSSQFIAGHLNQLLVFVGLNAVIGLLAASFIDWRAHAGGLAAGALLGYGVDYNGGKTPVVLQIATIVGVAALGVGLVAWRTATFSC